MGKKLKVLLVILLVFMCPIMVNADEIIDNPNEEVELLPLEVPKFTIQTGNGNNSLSISNYVEGVTYHIYRSTKSNKGFNEIDTTTSSEYLDTTALIGTKYYYRVTAARGEETTKYNTVNKTNTLASTKVSAKVLSKSSVELTWTEVSGADGYQVYRATSKKGKYTKVGNTSEATTFTNTKLTPGKKYYYKVRAYKKVNGKTGYSAYSAVVAITPNVAKAKYSVATYDYNKIKVSIEKVAGANGYQIYRATSKNGKYKLVKTTTSTSYVDSKLTTGKTYYYKVRAYAKVGSSKKPGSFNNVVSTKPQLKMPTFSVTNNSKDTRKSLIIKINKVAGATGYVIYRKEGDTWKKVTTTKSTSYTNSKLILGTEYTYTVKAYRVVSKKNVYSAFNEQGVTGKTKEENSDEYVKKIVNNLLEKDYYSKQALIDKLLDYGFDKTRANFAADTTYGEDEHKINYKEQALLQGRAYELKKEYTEKKMREALKKKLYTTEDINYAINYMYHSELVEAPDIAAEHYIPDGYTPFDDDSVRIIFSDNAKGEGIELYYAESPDARFELLESKTLFQLSQNKNEIVVKVPAGKHYYYKVKSYITYNNEKMYSEYSNDVDYYNELETPEYVETQEPIVNSSNKSRTYTISVDPEGIGTELYYVEDENDEVYKLYKSITKNDLKYNSANQKWEYKITVQHGKYMQIKGRNYVKYGDQTIYSEMSNEVTLDNRLSNPSLSYEDISTDYNNRTIKLIISDMSVKNVEVFYSETEQGNLVEYTGTRVTETEEGVGNITVKVPLGKKYYFKVRLYSNVTEAGQEEPVKLVSGYSDVIEIDNTLQVPELEIYEESVNNHRNTINLIIPKSQSKNIDVYYAEDQQAKYKLYTETNYTITFNNEGDAYIKLNIPAGKHYFFKVRTTSTVNNTKIESEMSSNVEYDNSLNTPNLSMEEVRTGAYYLYVTELKGTKVEVERSTVQGTGYTRVSDYERSISSTTNQISIYVTQSAGQRYFYRVRLVYEEEGKSAVYSEYSSPIELNTPKEES